MLYDENEDTFIQEKRIRPRSNILLKKNKKPNFNARYRKQLREKQEKNSKKKGKKRPSNPSNQPKKKKPFD
jgi:hypothetical protein